MRQLLTRRRYYFPLLVALLVAVWANPVFALDRFNHVTYRVESVHSISELSVAIAPDGKMAAHLRTCSRADYFGCCVVDWNTANLSFAPSEGSDLAELLRKADVYSGNHVGRDNRGLDFPLETIEVNGSRGLAILVVSENRTFEDGPRAVLLNRLRAIGIDLKANVNK